jgi:hypothetical protein
MSDTPEKQEAQRVNHRVNQVTVSQEIDKYDDGTVRVAYWTADGNLIGQGVITPPSDTQAKKPGPEEVSTEDAGEEGE